MQSTIAVSELVRETIPLTLRDVPNPPDRLYVRGSLPAEPPVAIVGSRRATAYGRRVAGVLAARLAVSGMPVVSGLAFGIDITAHRAVLEAGGRSVAVIPAGLGDQDITPQAHLSVFRQMLERGAALSEYPPGTGARKEFYLARNRLIAGLARAVVVVEAALPSGSLTTAQHAIEQGREVWAVPGEIDRPTAAGTNRLIRDGAHPLTSIEEFLESLGLEAAAPPTNDDHPLLEMFDRHPRHIDEVAEASGLAATELETTLTKLELLGLVRHVGGRCYVRS